MVKVKQDLFPESEGYYMDGTLKENLDIIDKIVRGKDRDNFIIVVGDPGEGKSTFTFQLATYFYPKFDLNLVCSNAKDFGEVVKTRDEKYLAPVLDEAFGDLASSKAISRDFNEFINMTQTMRQKNWFVFIIIPNFFDLSKTMALFRSKWLIRCYSRKGERGYFEVWGKERKQRLYIDGKKHLNYRCVRPNFRGRFTKFMTIDEEAYRKKKMNALKEMMDRDRATDQRTSFAKKTRDGAIKKLHKEGKKRKELAELFGLSIESINAIIRGER